MLSFPSCDHGQDEKLFFKFFFLTGQHPGLGGGSKLGLCILLLEVQESCQSSIKPQDQGFNGIRTRDLRDTGAMLYQLSYEATHWERGQLIEFISSRTVK